jgi:hypothetical protein
MTRGGATAAAVLLALAGCSRPSTVDAGAEPAIGPVPALLASAGLRLPVEDYLPTADQKDRLSRAQVALVRSCLARFGIRYDVVPVRSGGYGPVSLTDRRYGITDARLAAQHGYGLGPRDPALMPRPDRPRLGADGENVLSGQGRSVVNGQAVPPGGCIGEADRGLTSARTPAADLRRGGDLQLDTFARSRVDSRVQSVFQAWSTCMGRAGYAYADPLAAAGDPAFIGSVDQHQLAVAAADIGCKAATNLVGVWFTVEAAYQSRVIAANRAAFTATRSAIEARDQLAAAADR